MCHVAQRLKLRLSNNTREEEVMVLKSNPIIKTPLLPRAALCRSVTEDLVKILHKIDKRSLDHKDLTGERVTHLSTEEITRLSGLATILHLFGCETDLIGKV